MQATKTATLAHPGMHVPEAPTAPVRAHAADFHRLGADGKIGFAEAYMAGD
jgi:hypothetical protein